jgi:hypothetical protein
MAKLEAKPLFFFKVEWRIYSPNSPLLLQREIAVITFEKTPFSVQVAYIPYRRKICY